MSVSSIPEAGTQPARRSPRLARMISILPGLGQVYYGAYARAAQYFAGVVLCAGGAAVVYELSFELAGRGIGPVVASIGFIVSELVALALVVSAISFWIAASWDARQGSIARSEGLPYHPTWWYVKVRQFLFEDPDEEPAGD